MFFYWQCLIMTMFFLEQNIFGLYSSLLTVDSSDIGCRNDRDLSIQFFGFMDPRSLQLRIFRRSRFISTFRFRKSSDFILELFNYIMFCFQFLESILFWTHFGSKWSTYIFFVKKLSTVYRVCKCECFFVIFCKSIKFRWFLRWFRLFLLRFTGDRGLTHFV